VCPASSSSSEGSTKLSDCVCNSGYYGSSSTGCLLCTIGGYCPGGGSITNCPAHSTSAAGSDGISDCHCVAGFYQVYGSSVCNKCPAGSYCVGGTAKADCPAHSSSGEQSRSLQDCSCVAGYYGEPQNCRKCPAGWYCPGGKEKSVCPASSSSSEGSTKLSDCVCNSGYYGSSSTACIVCTAGSYCPGDGSSHVCPTRQTSLEGSQACVCKPGYVTSGNDCNDCPAGSFCSANGHATLCSPDSSSDGGAKFASDCHCRIGFVNHAYEDKNKWFSVPSGSWQDVVDACQAQGGRLASIHNDQEMRTARAVCGQGDCYIGLYRDSSNGAFKWLDGSNLDYTAWAYGEPQSYETKVVMTGAQGDQWVDLGTGSEVRKGICKMRDVQPECKEGMKPSDLNMNPGFLGKFYFIHQEITKMPEQYMATHAPDLTVVMTKLKFFNNNELRAVDSRIPDSLVAAYWTGVLFVVQAGTYTFSTDSDDGSTLFVDGRKVVDNDGLHPTRKKSGSIQLRAGAHVIEANWFNNYGGAAMHVMYQGPDTNGNENDVTVYHFAQEQGSLPDPSALNLRKGISAEYFYFNSALNEMPNVDSRSVDLRMVTNTIDFENDEFSSFSPEFPPNNFAAVYRGFFAVYQTGDYEFSLTSSDGSNLWINGLKIIDNSGIHPKRTIQGRFRLLRGLHFFKVDFFEKNSGGRLELQYKGTDTNNEFVYLRGFLPPLAPGAAPYTEMYKKKGGKWKRESVIEKEEEEKQKKEEEEEKKKKEEEEEERRKKGNGGEGNKGGNGGGLKSGNGQPMAAGLSILNSYCAQFRDGRSIMTQDSEMTMLAQCMSQDCQQAIAPKIGCRWTDALRLCYAPSGQAWCDYHPDSSSCYSLNDDVDNNWKPIQSIAAASDPNFKYGCTCMKKCTYSKKSKTLRCSDSYTKAGLDDNPWGNSIINDGEKSRECVCACGQPNAAADTWMYSVK